MFPSWLIPSRMSGGRVAQAGRPCNERFTAWALDHPGGRWVPFEQDGPVDAERGELPVRWRRAVEGELHEHAPPDRGVLEAVRRPESDHDPRRLRDPVHDEIAVR